MPSVRECRGLNLSSPGSEVAVTELGRAIRGWRAGHTLVPFFLIEVSKYSGDTFDLAADRFASHVRVMIENILQRAVEDNRLSHGAFRLLALMQMSPKLGSQKAARRLQVVEIAGWRKQLVAAGYLNRGGFSKKSAPTIGAPSTVTLARS